MPVDVYPTPHPLGALEDAMLAKPAYYYLTVVELDAFRHVASAADAGYVLLAKDQEPASNLDVHLENLLVVQPLSGEVLHKIDVFVKVIPGLLAENVEVAVGILQE
jgi:hypothetical protein